MFKSRQGCKCNTCGVMVPPDKQAEHMNSKIHLLQIFLHKMDNDEANLLKNKEGIRIRCRETQETGSIILMRCLASEFVTINLEIHSDDYDVRLQKTVVIKDHEVVTVVNPVEESCVRIRKGTSHLLTLRASSDQECTRLVPLCLKFSRPGQSDILIMRYIRVDCVDPMMSTLEPESPYVSVEPVARLPAATKIVKMKILHTSSAKKMLEDRRARLGPEYVPGSEEDADDYLTQTEAVRKIPLHMYFPSKFLEQVHIDGLDEKPHMTDDYKERLRDVQECLDIGISEEHPENYAQFFTTLLSFEDIQQDTDIRMYDNPSTILMPSADEPERFELRVEGLEEGRPSILRYDKIYVREEDGTVEYEGYIDRTKATSVEIMMPAQFVMLHDTADDVPDDDEGMVDDDTMANKRYGVRFTVNRKTMRLMYRALAQYEDVLQKYPIDRLLMPRIEWPAIPTLRNLNSMELVNKHIEGNPEQFCAVRNIVLGLHRPAAYVLFGPPGTGKTTTITEAIIQVYKLLPDSRILIVTPSNSAANVVTEKILNSNAVPKSDIFRLFGVTAGEHRASPEIRAISNWSNTFKQFGEVAMDKVMLYRIVACTLTMSGSVVTMGVPRGFFTHIFIDEAGHAMEPEALIPLTGLLEVYNGEKKLGGSVILSGDHLQLGPIIRSPIAKSYGMVKSLLERIMETKPYRRMENNAYNPMVLTKLVRNFRSHPKILAVPNNLFYDGELEAHGNKDVTHSLVYYHKLPQKGVPIIFHGVFGRELRESSNPSFFNPEEISVILGYVKDLLSEKTETFDNTKIEQSDIGIITPYRKQVLKLRGILKAHDFNDVSVGSTEEFQGQERLIVIISTVRCSQKVFDTNPGLSLGFLQNRKRFNVAVTRAKALMIVVGDPRVLNRDFRWRKLMEACDEDSCSTGERCISAVKQYDDLFKKLQELEIQNFSPQNLKTMKLSSKGQVTITQLALEEEPQWREEE